MIELKIYDKDDVTVKKTVKAEPVKVMFGVIRDLAALFKVDEMNDISQIYKVVTVAWEDVTALLDKCFPDIEDEDWRHVTLQDVVMAVFGILKDSLFILKDIPKEKNGMGE